MKYIVGFKYPLSKTIYDTFNDQVVIWINKMDFIMEKLILNICIWPKLITSLINYYTTDLQTEAFELPFRTW